MKIKLAVLMLIAGMIFSGYPGTAANQYYRTFDNKRIERLEGLCKLWGTIKYFHPYLAYKPIDWDRALIDAIPKVKAASSVEEYRCALGYLLSFLADPMTAVLDGRETTGGETRGNIEQGVPEKDLCLKWLKKNIALINVKNYLLFTDMQKLERLSQLMTEAAGAETVILDIRRRKGLAYSEVDSYYFSRAFIQSLPVLFEGECIPSSSRHRVHSGYTPQLGDTSGGYYSGFVYNQGTAVMGQKRNGQKNRLIFLIDDRPTGVETILSGLQKSAGALIIQEGEKAEETAIALFSMKLPEGVSVRIRLNETVNSEGSIGFSPDFYVQAKEGDSDFALIKAVDISEGKSKVSKSAKTPLPPNPAMIKEKSYPEMTFPSEEYRLLSLFRFWNVIHYFFPYIDLMDRPWEETLGKYIPRFEKAANALEYNLTVMELVAAINDSHGFSFSPVFNEYIGSHSPAVEVRNIEGRTVVTRIQEDPAGNLSGLQVGDIVLAVDDEDVEKAGERLGRYFAASTPQALELKIHQNLLKGEQGSRAKIKFLSKTGEVREGFLNRTERYFIAGRMTPVFDVLPEGYGYIDLARLQVGEVDKAFEAVRNTPALIMDMRGYPQGTIWSIGPRLVGEKTPVARFKGVERQAILLDWPFECTVLDSTAPNGKWRYTGKVVVLINEEAISQSEHSCLFLEAAADALFIGSPTNGANGDVTRTILPGGIIVNFTGVAVSHADGRQLQRIGILPDVEVKPTIAGIRQGRDEVLERAVEELKKRGL